MRHLLGPSLQEQSYLLEVSTTSVQRWTWVVVDQALARDVNIRNKELNTSLILGDCNTKMASRKGVFQYMHTSISTRYQDDSGSQLGRGRLTWSVQTVPGVSQVDSFSVSGCGAKLTRDFFSRKP